MFGNKFSPQWGAAEYIWVSLMYIFFFLKSVIRLKEDQKEDFHEQKYPNKCYCSVHMWNIPLSGFACKN